MGHWTEAGDDIVLIINAKEYIRNNKINKFRNRFGLKKAVTLFLRGELPATYERRRESIDAILISGMFEIKNGRRYKLSR